MMEILLGIIAALIGGIFFYKKKARTAGIESKLAETKGRDAELQVTEQDLKNAIAEIDLTIAELKKKKEAEYNKNKNMTLAERRARIKKGLK